MLTYFDCNYPFQYGQQGGSVEEHIFTCVSTKSLTMEEIRKATIPKLLYTLLPKSGIYEEWTSVLQHLPIIWYGFRSKSFHKIDDVDEFDHFNNFNHQLSQIQIILIEKFRQWLPPIFHMIKYWASPSRIVTLAILQLCPVANRYAK